jgi:nucleoside-diphosphate-sugar epimerase
VADGQNPTMAEVAEIVKELVPGARIRLGEASGVKPSHSGIDVTRMREEWGFSPRNIEQGIKSYLDWLKGGPY